MRVGRVFKMSAILPLILAPNIMLFLRFEARRIVPDWWMDLWDWFSSWWRFDFAFKEVFGKFLDDALVSNKQISPNNGPDYNNNALLSSAPWSAGMLWTQAFDSWNFFKQQKTKRSKARVLYYSNSTASFQILLRSDDISLTPVQRSAAQENKVPEVNKGLLGIHTGPDTVIFYGLLQTSSSIWVTGIEAL